jgi:hypothetical protein
MATPWETMKQQNNGNALGKQSKLRIAPHSSKSCMKIQNNITALFLSQELSLRGVRQNLNLKDKHLHDKAISN